MVGSGPVILRMLLMVDVSQMNLKTALFFAGIAGFGLPVAPALAQTATDSFDVTITITAECQITSTQALDFGSAGVLLANVDSSAILRVACTDGTPYNIGLDEGSGAGATIASRLMTSGGGATVTYGLFQDAARAVVWGDVIGSNTQASTGTGAAQDFTVYGRVAAQTTPAPDVYQDTVTVTVTY